METTCLSVEAIEAERLAKLASFAILDTPEEQEFDSLVVLAQRLFDVPMALVSLVDDHRQWFKAKCGLSASETAREIAFCAHAMHCDDIMIVEDATLDPRFADNPVVTGDPGIRFYAGVPLRPASPGFSDDLPGIGTLCIADIRPRTLSADEQKTLRELAGLVSALIRARASAATALRLSEESRRHADLLARQHVQLRQAERMAGIGSWRVEFANHSVHWSDQVYAIHGLPPGKLPSIAEALGFYPEEQRGEIARLLERARSHGESFDFESDFTTADGRKRRVRSIGEVRMADGEPVQLIGVFQDVTERHAREELLRESADTDALTGLANRACFEKRLAEIVGKANQTGAPACLLLLDLDGFKGVNDTFGHAAGDDILRTMADRLRGFAHSSGFAARLGGDEFVLLLTRPRDCARIEDVITLILTGLRQTVERDGEVRAVSATIGAAFVDADTPIEILRRADIALYEAKRFERGTGRISGSPEVLRAYSPRVAAA